MFQHLPPGGMTYCSVCEDGGNVTQCDKCPRVYHNECMGLQAPPQASPWLCPRCVDAQQKRREEDAKTEEQRRDDDAEVHIAF